MPEVLSTFWAPRHGQYVLCAKSLPYSHVTSDGKSVGIYQQASPVINPATGLPYAVKNAAGEDTAFPQMNPPHVVPMDKHGRNVAVDRLNYADLKGYEVLIPGQGVKHIRVGAEGEAVDKYFADNPRSELNLVLSLAEAEIVGPLLDRNDMPPGRVLAADWTPKP